MAVVANRANTGFPFLNGPMGQLNIAFQQRGGGLRQPIALDHPIEMRGGGYDIASMKGGYLIGPFRPITDESFISESMSMALTTLRDKINKTGSLSPGSEAAINQLVTDLKKKEKDVKTTRDNLISLNNAIANGEFTPGANVTQQQIEEEAEKYNRANKERQSLENKGVRVIVTLNGFVVNQ